jgi:hypothetical protein
MWITDLSGGPDLYQGSNAALDVAVVLTDFIKSGKATANPGHDGICNVETTVGGHILIEAFVEAERRNPRLRLIQKEDGRRSSECVTPEHTYKVSYIEF